MFLFYILLKDFDILQTLIEICHFKTRILGDGCAFPTSESYVCLIARL
jgi:hypothetical protein